MTPERRQRIEELFAMALECPPEERGRFLDHQCGTDASLRTEIDKMLHQDACTQTVHHIAGQMAPALAETRDGWEGRCLGPYRILRTIGRGGMGRVFLAARDDDQYRKEVAIKTIRFEAASEFALHRFRHERQVLAGLEHPNIARLLDGGASEQGMPYIVMEYVAGVPITSYALEQNLSIEARLQLFRQVCDAVQYAHQRLVVHRDIKPANILVTPEGVPKLLDFGIAKLLEQEDTEVNATRTITGFLLMTPDYASPEQFRGEPVSTATDVYSLGAVLYELLTGQRAHVRTSGEASELARVVCETGVKAPSTVGGRRLRGDLDNIVLKAMHKEATRRYQSVGQFSEDLDRYLRALPVLARPDSIPYRMSKYIRRHRVGVAALAAVLVSLALGTAVSLNQARQARRQFNQVRQLANRFLFDFDAEIVNIPGTVKAREMIVSTALEYLNRLASEASGDPGLQWELAAAFGKVAGVQGSVDRPSLRRLRDGLSSYDRAFALARPLADRHLLNIQQQEGLINMLCEAQVILRSLKEFEQATRLGREAMDRSANVSAFAKSRALTQVAITLGLAGDPAGNLEGMKQALAVDRELARQEPVFDNRLRVAATLYNLGVAHFNLTGFAEASAAETEALAIFQSLASERPNDLRVKRRVFQTLMRLGDIAGASDRPSFGDPAGAAARYDEAIAAMEPLLAADPKDRASRSDVGLVHVKAAGALGEVAPRRALVHGALAIQLLDDSSPDNTEFRAAARGVVANAHRALGDFAAAERLLEEAGRILKAPGSETEADLDLVWARLESGRGNRGLSRTRFDRVIAAEEELFQKARTPQRAWELARKLELAAVALPESSASRRRRIVDVWTDQDRRFPGRRWIEQRLMEARRGLSE